MERKSIRREKYANALNVIKDIDLKMMIEDIWESSTSQGIAKQATTKFYTMERFCYEIADKTIKDMTWRHLCELVQKDESYGFPCMHIILRLLREERYAGEHKEKLIELQDCFDIGKKGLQYRWYKNYFVFDDIKYAVYISEASNRKLYFIKTDNEELHKILKEFCIKDVCARGCKEDTLANKWFWNNLGKFFEVYERKIHCVADFNYQIFHHMENQCKSTPYPASMLRLLYRFFSFLIEYPSGEGRNIFLVSDPIDHHALKRDDLGKRIAEGYQYIYYNPYASVPDSDKWILQINGFDKGTTKLKATASKLYDFTSVKSSFYRKLVKEHVWKDGKSNFNTKYERFICLREMLNKLTEIKRKSAEAENYITINETSFMRMWLKNQSITNETKTAKIVSFRQFLESCEAEEKISTEYFATEYLKQYDISKKSTAHAIPEEDLEKLNAVMMAKAGDSFQNTYCYAILHILLQTEFRLSQVCHINKGAVLPTVNRNQFLLTSSKTSNGQVYEAVITDFTKALIDDVELVSKEIRNECTSDNKKYLFLYKTKENQYIPIEGRYFRDYMSRCCKEAKIDNYTPANLRDFHMTKAEEENLRKGYSDVRLRTLSGHAHVDMTHNHYIEMKLTQIIEAMYGIIIGEVDVNGNIVDAIPDEINEKSHLVETGCGYCGEPSCIDDTMISCLLCKSFYTTFLNLKEFKALMMYIDGLIESGKWEHDKEDLMNRKRLIAAYILAIEMRMAEKEGVVD